MYLVLEIWEIAKTVSDWNELYQYITCLSISSLEIVEQFKFFQRSEDSDLSLLLSIFFFFSYNFTIMGKLIRQDIIMLKSISPVSNPRSVQTISIIIRHSFVIECLFSVLDAERKLFMITWNFVWTNLFVKFAWIQQFFLKMC